MADRPCGDQDLIDGVFKLPVTPKTPSPQKNAKSVTDPTIKKRIHDLIIDLHGCVQKWETLNQNSFQSLNTLINLMSQIKSSEEEYDRDPSAIGPECWTRFKVKLLNLRESLINDHIENVTKLEAVYTKMKKTTSQLEALSYLNLSSNQSKYFDEVKDVVFNTWSSEDFYRSARSLLNSYTKEWLLKQRISKHFLDMSKTEASQSTLYVSMWLHQPYIDDSCNTILESMLLESGIK